MDWYLIVAFSNLVVNIGIAIVITRACLMQQQILNITQTDRIPLNQHDC